MEYLDFELPLKDLNDQLENCKKLGNEGNVDVKDTLQEIKSKLLSKKTKTKASDIPSAKFKPIPPLFLKDDTVTANTVKMITDIGMEILLFFSNI